jgi:hypothetical protein
MQLSIWCIPVRQRVGHHINATSFVLCRKIKARQLAYPVVLRYGGEAQFEDVLEWLVIRLDERTSPEVWAPMSHSLGQANELAFIGGETTVTRWECTAEESDNAA